jgi:hypothetical protein
MSDDRILDFLGALVCTDPALEPASITPVRYQVRTGITAPSKEQMRQTQYEILVWRFHVSDLKRFADFLALWETGFSNEFHKRSRASGLIDDRDPKNLQIYQSYLGTFPRRSPGGAASHRFNTSWGGKSDRLLAIERCRVAIPGQLASSEDQWLASELAKLFEHIEGEIEIEVLDPSIGF